MTHVSKTGEQVTFVRREWVPLGHAQWWIVYRTEDGRAWRCSETTWNRDYKRVER